MELLSPLLDFVLHVDQHLAELLADYGLWLYAIVFLVVFAETGLVVTPFLPGDSLLFALGALAAIDTSGTLTAPLLTVLLTVAAILGNTTNYAIGRRLGHIAMAGRLPLVSREHLRDTEAYYQRHGAMTLVLSRFAPILRTFAPFVAGIAGMHYGRFQAYSISGAVLWVASFVWAGYLFGNLPGVRDHFGLITIGIIVVTLAPAAIMAWRGWRRRRSAGR
ncbi:MAG: hypothetical protein RL026_1678 [Pseudomonadota bacterium]|jgi:membrane-associated protein